MHPRFPKLVALLLAAAAASTAARAQNLVANPGFEDRLEGWNVFIPADAAANAPQATIEESDRAHGGNFAARFQASAASRFALSSRSGLTVNEGERYRLFAWYRAEPGAAAKPGTPGLLLRATLSGEKAGVDSPSGHLYIGPGGAVSAQPGKNIGAPLAEEWTRIEAVIAIPAQAKRLNLNLFAWSLVGSVWIDDVGLERVPDDTPLTPILAAAATPAVSASASKPTAPSSAADGPFPPPATPPLAAGQEREVALPNSGFETDLRGWETGGDGGMSQASPQGAYYGTQGLRVTDNSPEAGSSLQSPYLPAAPGRLYHARFWGRVVNGDGVAVYLRFYDKERRLLNTPELKNENLFFLPKTASSFRQFVLEATAPADAVAVRLWVHSISRSLVTADFDEFTVVEAQR